MATLYNVMCALGFDFTAGSSICTEKKNNKKKQKNRRHICDDLFIYFIHSFIHLFIRDNMH